MVTLSKDWKRIASTEVDVTGFTGTFGLYAKYLSQDITNNQTKVAYEWRLTEVSYGWITSDEAQDYVSSAGWNESTYREYLSAKTLRYGEETITHNADGTKSDYGRGRTVMGGMGVDTGYIRGDYDLPTIPRASVPSINTWPASSPNFTLGDTIIIHMNRKSTSFTHTVYFKYGSTSVRVGAEKGVTNNVSFDTSTVEDAILALIPTSQSYTGSIEVITYNGNSVVGSKTIPYVASINTAVEHPIVDSISVEDVNERTSSITQDDSIYIANISTLKATVHFSVSGTHTELKSYKITCGSQTVSDNFPTGAYSAEVEETFDRVNADHLTVVVTDKRGTTNTMTKSWTLIEYQPLTISTATVTRPSATGSTGVGQISGMAYGGNFGATPNELTVYAYFKRQDEDSYDHDPDDHERFSIALPTAGFNSYANSEPMTFQFAFDYRYQYDVKFVVEDLFSTATYYCQLMQGLPILSWDENEVDVFGNLHIHDREDPYIYQDVLGGFDAVFENHGEKNLCPLTNPSLTQNGVTFTREADYVNVNGTASANAFFNASGEATELIQGHQYILSGLHDEWVSGMQIFVRYVASSDIIAIAEKDDVEFTCPAPCFAYLLVKTGTSVSNKKWYPMIRDARIASPTFVPNWGINNWHYSGTWTNNSNVTRTYKISGRGLVFAMATVVSATTNDTGTVGAYVDLRTSSSFVRTLGANRNRLTSADTNAIQASATGVYFYDGTSSNNHLRLYAGCSKNGTNTWYFEFVTIGCSISQV